MPELPEVETVRDGLSRWLTGRTVRQVEVHHPRAVRRHLGGLQDFSDRLSGQTVAAARRRGKYLWIEFADSEQCLVAHLGMSGQMLLQPRDSVYPPHAHVVFDFTDGGAQLRFVDQRTFGGVHLDQLCPDPMGTYSIPAGLTHIARDPFDPAFSREQAARAIRRRRSAVKRVLLDQTVVSGIGNIYADEALWRARLHPERPADSLTQTGCVDLLGVVTDVLSESLMAGGTSFDSLYVNVNGQSGYFARHLDAYGREGEPCHRCGQAIRRAAFMNRSSFFCARCQRPPRMAKARTTAE